MSVWCQLAHAKSDMASCHHPDIGPFHFLISTLDTKNARDHIFKCLTIL